MDGLIEKVIIHSFPSLQQKPKNNVVRLNMFHFEEYTLFSMCFAVYFVYKGYEADLFGSLYRWWLVLEYYMSDIKLIQYVMDLDDGISLYCTTLQLTLRVYF